MLARPCHADSRALMQNAIFSIAVRSERSHSARFHAANCPLVNAPQVPRNLRGVLKKAEPRMWKAQQTRTMLGPRPLSALETTESMQAVKVAVCLRRLWTSAAREDHMHDPGASHPGHLSLAIFSSQVGGRVGETKLVRPLCRKVVAAAFARNGANAVDPQKDKELVHEVAALEWDSYSSEWSLLRGTKHWYWVTGDHGRGGTNCTSWLEHRRACWWARPSMAASPCNSYHPEGGVLKGMHGSNYRSVL